MSVDEEKRESHPSYGVVCVSRCSCGCSGTTLVGSEVDHQHYFALEISEAEKYGFFGQERFSRAGKRRIVEIHLSANQFMDMLTNVSIGDGIPCTIAHVDGISRPRPAREKPRIEVASDYGKDAVKQSISQMRGQFKAVLELCQGLSAVKRKEIERILDYSLNTHSENCDFYIKRIVEATEKSVSFAKTEVENYVAAVVRSLGVKSLQMLATNQKDDEGGKTLDQ